MPGRFGTDQISLLDPSQPTEEIKYTTGLHGSKVGTLVFVNRVCNGLCVCVLVRVSPGSV